MDISMWQNLLDVFGKINVAYDKAIELGERKHKALVIIDMDDLAKILDEEQLLTAKIQKLEKQRGELLIYLSKSEPTIKLDSKMEDLFNLEPTRAVEERLKTLHKNLTKKVEQTITLRDNNQILAQSALNAVKYHLNKIGGATVEPTYGSSGNDIVTHKKKFDFKA